jgi:hypothetical protein
LLEARALLKESTMADIKGDAEAFQCPHAKTISKMAGAASLCAPTPTLQNEVELLKGLEDASQDLRRLVTNTRTSASPHPLRNYRRKYRKVQRLHQQMSSRIAQNAVLDKDWSFDAKDVADKVLACDLLPDKRVSKSSRVKGGGETSHNEGGLETVLLQRACSARLYSLHQLRRCSGRHVCTMLPHFDDRRPAHPQRQQVHRYSE